VARDGLQKEEETMFGKMSLTPWRGRFGLLLGEREKKYPLDVFHREFDHLFENLWHNFDPPMIGRQEMPFGTVMPRIDMMEDEDRIHLTVELPGMDERDVEVTLSDNALTIKGEKKVELEETEKPYAYMERFYGSFCRRIPLDIDVVTDKVEATFEKGVLSINLPKVAEAKKSYKKVPIHTVGKVKKLEKVA
jgi:HSP20 family protein